MNPERIYTTLLGPHLSEKAAIAAEANQFVFKVAIDANKLEVMAPAAEMNPHACVFVPSICSTQETLVFYYLMVCNWVLS